MTGRPAADFSLETLDGDSYRLPGLKGKAVLLEFWAPWCPGCLDNIEPLNRLSRRFQGRLQIIAVSLEQGEKTLRRFMTGRQIAYQVAVSNRELLESYEVAGIPLTVLIDADGIVRCRCAGLLRYEEMAARIESLS